MKIIKKCCFAGHSEIYNNDLVFDIIIDKAEELITQKDINEFWVGNYGAFDYISAAAVRELKEKCPNISLVLIIPYLTKGINEYREQYYKNYDEIVITEIPEKTPKKYCILKANEYMVDNSDYLICFVNHSWGGSAKTLEYAERKKHIIIFNLA